MFYEVYVYYIRLTTHIGGFIGCYRFINGERTHRWFFTVILRFFIVELSVVRFARGIAINNVTLYVLNVHMNEIYKKLSTIK